MTYRASRSLFRFGAVFALATLTLLAACGGSSSETPPPLQPDPAGFRYASAPPSAIADDKDAGDAPRTIFPETTAPDPKPRVPAPPTWGSGGAAH